MPFSFIAVTAALAQSGSSVFTSSIEDVDTARSMAFCSITATSPPVTASSAPQIPVSEEGKPTATVERYSKGADAVQALIADKVDCVIIDNEPAKEFVKVNNK